MNANNIVSGFYIFSLPTDNFVIVEIIKYSWGVSKRFLQRTWCDNRIMFASEIDLAVH